METKGINMSQETTSFAVKAAAFIIVVILIIVVIAVMKRGDASAIKAAGISTNKFRRMTNRTCKVECRPHKLKGGARARCMSACVLRQESIQQGNK